MLVPRHVVIGLFILLIVGVAGTVLYKWRHIEFFEQNQCAKQLSTDDIDVYLINLDRNRDRLDHFIDQYMSTDLKNKQFKRYPAVDGRKLSIEKYVSSKALNEIYESEESGYRTKHYQLTRGAVGCYLSHMSVYEAIMKGDREYGLIFEDDVIIDPKILSKLNKMITSMPNDWDVLLLGCYCIKCDKFDRYYNTERFFLTHCYIVRKTAAERIVEALKDKPIEQQIDSELSDMATDSKLKIYCLKESICKQGGGFKTTIQMPLKVVPGINPYQTVN